MSTDAPDGTAAPAAAKPVVPPESHRVPARFLAPYAAATLGMWMAILTPVILTLAVKVERIAPDGKETALSAVLGAGAVLGLLCNPIFGQLSDRTTSRWGRRRPWLVGSVVTGTGGLVVTGTATSLPVLLLGWCVTQAAFNAMLATMLALLPDHVPAPRRGLVSGVLGVCQALAAVSGAALAQITGPHSAMAFVIPGLVACATCGWLVAVLPDRRLKGPARSPFSWRELLHSFWVDPRRHPDFAWAWLSRFMIFMAISSVLNYQVYYLTDQLGLSKDESTRMVAVGIAVQTGVVVVGSYLFGWLSDRLARRKPFVVTAAAIGAAGLLTLALGQSVTWFLCAMALVGLGQGVYFAVDLALVTDVLPDSRTRAAKDLGVINIANILPQSIAPAFAPVFIGLGGGDNYTALFLAGTAFAVASAVTIVPVRGVR
ncbi:MFS transporter [Streptomyces sp. NPDC088747]|uniref:MFS transporter n=1 Tax=Streptomyces sp. NPDC088747 TaxID=3365886 RepID=UPI0038245415